MKEIADLLDVPERTVAFHKYTIMGHLGVKTIVVQLDEARLAPADLTEKPTPTQGKQ